MASEPSVPKTVSCARPGVEVVARAQSEAGPVSPVGRRRRVRCFKTADGWYNRFVRLASVLHEGFWLGCLSTEDLNAITASHYQESREYPSEEHNLRGFFDWEASALGRYFRPGSRILVAAAGGGREVLALRRAGYEAEGLECSAALVGAVKPCLNG
jgi:hypothetical protein